MAIRIGYLLPTREQVMEGRPEVRVIQFTASSERANRILKGLPRRRP